MTRKEKIKRAAFEYADKELIGIIDFKKEEAFIEGAMWADEHPVVKVGGAIKNYERGYEDAIDKTCEWLEQHLHHDNVGGFWADATDVDDFINQFKSSCSELPNNLKEGEQ